MRARLAPSRPRRRGTRPAAHRRCTPLMSARAACWASCASSGCGGAGPGRPEQRDAPCATRPRWGCAMPRWQAPTGRRRHRTGTAGPPAGQPAGRDPGAPDGALAGARGHAADAARERLAGLDPLTLRSEALAASGRAGTAAGARAAAANNDAAALDSAPASGCRPGWRCSLRTRQAWQALATAAQQQGWLRARQRAGAEAQRAQLDLNGALDRMKSA